MKIRSLTTLLFGLCSFSTAWACTVNLFGVEASTQFPAVFTTSKETKISSHYKDTRCMQFKTSKKKSPVGFLCTSTDTDLLTDFGVSSNEEKTRNPASDTDQRSYTVGTPMSSYEMKPMEIGSHTLYVADTDCDEANESIYRATSTCHVAIMPLGNHLFLYGNFVLKNHMDSSRGVEEKDVIALWKSLKISTD